MGKADYASLGGLVGFYLIGTPLGWYLTFERGYNLKGLWLGMTGAVIFLTLFYQFIISFKFDWK